MIWKVFFSGQTFNSLILISDKIKVMLMGTHPKLRLGDSFSIEFKDTIFESVYSFKYFGVVMHVSLS